MAGSFLKIEGLEEIFDTVDSLGNVGKKISTSALKKAMKPGLEIIKSKAPKDTSQGSKKLRIGSVKQYKDGGLQGKMGIDEKNWEECKQLWFQHWGYSNNGWGGNLGGKKVTKHVGWFNEATDNAESTILDNLEKEINSALDKVLK